MHHTVNYNFLEVRVCLKPRRQPNRFELEAQWRAKVKEARKRFLAADARYRKAVKDQQEGVITGSDGFHYTICRAS
jgi:hypothetical protein